MILNNCNLEKMMRVKNCENCKHSCYEDLWLELCCDIDKKYIGELHTKERAKNCEHYERNQIKSRN